MAGHRRVTEAVEAAVEEARKRAAGARVVRLVIGCEPFEATVDELSSADEPHAPSLLSELVSQYPAMRELHLSRNAAAFSLLLDFLRVRGLPRGAAARRALAAEADYFRLPRVLDVLCPRQPQKLSASHAEMQAAETAVRRGFAGPPGVRAEAAASADSLLVDVFARPLTTLPWPCRDDEGLVLLFASQRLRRSTAEGAESLVRYEGPSPPSVACSAGARGRRAGDSHRLLHARDGLQSRLGGGGRHENVAPSRAGRAWSVGAGPVSVLRRVWTRRRRGRRLGSRCAPAAAAARRRRGAGRR